MKDLAFILIYCAALVGLYQWLSAADVPAPTEVPVLVETKAPRAGFICTPTLTPPIPRPIPTETV
jgi:hypothetical protein